MPKVSKPKNVAFLKKGQTPTKAVEFEKDEDEEFDSEEDEDEEDDNENGEDEDLESEEDEDEEDDEDDEDDEDLESEDDEDLESEEDEEESLPKQTPQKGLKKEVIQPGSKRSAQQAVLKAESANANKKKLKKNDGAAVSPTKAGNSLKTESPNASKKKQKQNEGAALSPAKASDFLKAEPASANKKKLKANEGAAVSAAKAGTEKKPAEDKKRPLMPIKADKKLQEEIDERKRERDRCSLFFKNVAKNVTDDDIKGLSSDILSVKRRDKWAKTGWLHFASEQVCKKNHEKLKNAKLGGKELFVDFCGNKSQSPQKTGEYQVDAVKLYVGGLPASLAEEELKRVFPSAQQISHRSNKSFAFVNFATPQAARQAFDKNKNTTIKGSKIEVSFARIFPQRPKQDAVKKFAKKQTNGN